MVRQTSRAPEAEAAVPPSSSGSALTTYAATVGNSTLARTPPQRSRFRAWAPTLAREEADDSAQTPDFTPAPTAKLATAEPQMGDVVQIDLEETADGAPEGTEWDWKLGELDETVLAGTTTEASGSSVTLEADPVAPGSTTITPQVSVKQPGGAQSPEVPSVGVVIPAPTATFGQLAFTPCEEGGRDPRSAEALKVGDTVSCSATVDKATDVPDAVVDAEVKVSGASNMSPAAKWNGKGVSFEWLVPAAGAFDLDFAITRHDGTEVGKVSQKLKATMGKVGPAVLKAWEQELDAHQAMASGAARAIAADGDACVTSLKAAKDHLKQSNEHYKDAHKRVTDLLKKADTAQAIEGAITGMVQDALLGKAFGSVVGAFKAAKNFGESTAKLIEHADSLKSKGLAVADAAKLKPSDGGDTKASESGNAGGAAPGEQLEHTLSQLDAMIDTLPAYGRRGQVATSSAEAAARLSKSAAVGAAGGTGEFTPDEVGDKKGTVLAGKAAVEASRASVAQAKGVMAQMAASATAQEVKSVDDIEKDLWHAWVASLKSRKEKDAVDVDVIEKHLVELGVIPEYGYLSDADEDDAVRRARQKMLRDRGITPPDDDTKLECFYNRELKRDEIKARVVGQTGTTTRTADGVAVGGSTFGLATTMGGATEVVVSDVAVKGHLADATQLNWSDGDFQLSVKRVGDLGGEQ